MKIGTISFHASNNYGCILQSFALSEKIKAMQNDADVEEIYFRTSPLVYDKRPYIEQYKEICIKDNIPFSEEGLAAFSEKKRLMEERISKFRQFREDHMNMTDVIYDAGLIGTDRYDLCITGSDQVFGYGLVNGFEDAFFLKFAGKRTRKVSYAASMGTDVFEDDNKKRWLREQLRSLESISIREKSFYDSICMITDKDVSICLDPTLLHDADFWTQYEIKPKFMEKNKYVLLYTLGYPYCEKEDRMAAKMADDIAKKEGLQIIYYHPDTAGYLTGKDSRCFYYEGPGEFLWLVHHSEYVICCSFHATAFSVIFKKPFYTIEMPQNGARVRDLTDTLGIGERCIKDAVDPDEYDRNISWTECEMRLKTEQEISAGYLEKILHGS